ncbi:MAG TPA: LysM peptidoglycan-binding domain-containing protein [Actinobacteria bacterium]|nr:LysM peptidoglycan-binding domain-containing protein [Actinomycetota bacterium]
MDISLALMVGGAAVSLFAAIHTVLSPGRSRSLLAGGAALLLLLPALGAYAELAPLPTRLTKSSTGAFPTQGSSHPSTIYTVIRGDTLWKIAARDLETRDTRATTDAISRRWKGIYEGNRAVIGDDPNLIYPGQQYDLGGE